MKISHLRKQLEQLQEELGDQDVMIRGCGESDHRWFHFAGYIVKLAINEQGQVSESRKQLTWNAVGLDN